MNNGPNIEDGVPPTYTVESRKQLMVVEVVKKLESPKCVLNVIATLIVWQMSTKPLRGTIVIRDRETAGARSPCASNVPKSS